MRIQLDFEALTERQLRTLLVACSLERDNFPNSLFPWEPRVRCEGPYFHVTVSPVEPRAAARIVQALTMDLYTETDS